MLTYREDVYQSDIIAVQEIIGSSDFFSAIETEIAVELVKDRLTHGLRSGYHFLFAEQHRKVVGYTCFGPIAGTISSYDLYWIAVHNAMRGQGIGKELLRRSEERITARGGQRLYIETASRAQYEPTRRFYQRCGYRQEAILQDFYAPGDSKVIYVKIL